MKYLLSILVIIITSYGCKKTSIIQRSEPFIGVWVHHTSETDAHKVIINDDGTGSMEWIVDNKVSRATKVRDWYVNDNRLSFGKASFNGESYEIDKYPTFTWDELIKYYDTIPAENYYMRLDGSYYVRN